MKRIVAALAILSITASFSLGDYAHPPGWDEDLYFTHQSWKFATNTGSNTTDADAESLVTPNPDFTPVAIASLSGVWTNGYGSGDGGWLFPGPVGLSQDNIQFMLSIINTQAPDLVKQIWLQATFQAGFDLDVENDALFQAAANGTFYGSKMVSKETLDGGMTRVTVWLEDIIPPPEYEFIYISLAIPADNWVFVDEIHVDTRCVAVPEPSFLAVLAACGFICLAVRRIRKRPR